MTWGEIYSRPAKYAGHCAFAMSVGKRVEVVDNPCFKHHKSGDLYVFDNRIARALFSIIPGTIKRADARWLKLANQIEKDFDLATKKHKERHQLEQAFAAKQKLGEMADIENGL